MKKLISAAAVGAMALALISNTGCEWSGGGNSNSFNTSQGAGININFSGVYDGRLSGGEAVSGTGIKRLTISQAGNRLQVRDSRGRKD